MAHMYVFTRGHKPKVDKFINDLLSVVLPYKTKDDKGVEQTYPLEMGVRPIQLWELVYPKEQEDTILRLINPGKSWNKKYDKYITLVRKALGLKPMPKHEHKLETAILNRALNQVEVAGVGIKDDKFHTTTQRELL